MRGRTSIIVIVALLVVSSGCIAQRLPVTPEEQVKIDSVLTERLNFLRECLKAQGTPELSEKLLRNPDSLALNSIKQSENISFFEELTGHKAPRKNMYAMGKVYTSHDVDRWENWVKRNARLLVWETPRRRINRKDINIYQD